ncbi:MAG: hypothetical protein JXJ04_14700 [Spirochaetales bacterium]|nr:hypothetical protein [Spirochaetales bacterium]
MIKAKHNIIIPAVLLISLILPASLFAVSFGDKQVDALYQKALDATFTREKEVFTGQLGKLKSSAAKKALLALLDDSDSWTQEAAIAGLLLLTMPDVDRILIDKMLTEFMIDDKISEGIIRNGERFITPLIEKYKDLKKEEDREKILETLARIKHNQTDEFLKKIILNKQSGDRSMAFQYLLKYTQIKKEYVSQFYGDPDLREYALSWLVDNGTKPDIQVFLEILNKKNEKEAIIIICYEGINRWGNPELKQKIYLEALRNPREVLVRGALYIFGYMTSTTIVDELCRLTKQGETQTTRIKAASTLGELNEKKGIPYLISVLKENYIEEKGSLGIDILSGILTFGISAIMDTISAHMSRKEFDSGLRGISSSLKRMTGVDNGTSYETWLDWGILHGYTIDGINIIQYLFSGYPAKRAIAMEEAFTLLGFKNKNAYLKIYPGDKNKADADLALSLAALLIKKGYLADEEFE